MLLSYLDESYTEDWFVMAALLVDGPAAASLTDELGKVATAAVKAYECVTDLDTYARVIADEVDGQAIHRADLSGYREVGASGYRRRRLSRIVDTLHFAPSHASRLVQAADVISFLYRRTFTHRETDNRSRRAKVAMWNRLRPRVHHELCWFPSPPTSGQQHKWGQDVR